MLITIQIEADSLEEALAKLTAPANSATSFHAVPRTPDMPVVSASPQAAPSAPEPTAAPDSEPPTMKGEVPKLTDVRAVLADLRRSKGAAEAKALLQKHSVSSLSELPEETYADVIAAAKEAMR